MAVELVARSPLHLAFAGYDEGEGRYWLRVFARDVGEDFDDEDAILVVVAAGVAGLVMGGAEYVDFLRCQDFLESLVLESVASLVAAEQDEAARLEGTSRVGRWGAR